MTSKESPHEAKRSKSVKRLFKNKKAHGSTTHIIIGFIILVGLYFLNNYYGFYDSSTLTKLDIAFLIFITWSYSQAPDIDQPGSKISKYFTILSACIIIYAFYVNEPVIGIAATAILGLVRFMEHRELIHSIFAAFLFSAPLYFIKPIFAIIAFIMFIVHIASEGELSLFSNHDVRWLNFGRRQGRR